jgi:hypothetical protein
MAPHNNAMWFRKKSKQSVEATAAVVATAVQNVSQNCINYVDAQNQLVIRGNGNVVGNVSQMLSVSVDSNCVTQTAQSAEFQNRLQASATQLLEESGVAGLEWLDGSKKNLEAVVRTSVATGITATTVQNCLGTINSRNILQVQGDNNVVRDVTQGITANMISQCLLSNEQASRTINDITTAANQHSVGVSENPLTPIFDAVTATSQAAMMMFALMFIVVVAFVFMFGLPTGGGSKPKTGGAEPPPCGCAHSGDPPDAY